MTQYSVPPDTFSLGFANPQALCLHDGSKAIAPGATPWWLPSLERAIRRTHLAERRSHRWSRLCRASGHQLHQRTSSSSVRPPRSSGDNAMPTLRQAVIARLPCTLSRALRAAAARTHMQTPRASSREWWWGGGGVHTSLILESTVFPDILSPPNVALVRCVGQNQEDTCGGQQRLRGGWVPAGGSST